jgi:Pyridoxamine 5'-phosphate oxidase
MADLEPFAVTNLDRFGNPALPWSRVHDILAGGPLWPETTFFLGTVRPDARPHSAGLGILWIDGDLYFTSSPKTRKSRNLAENPACTISGRLEGMDIVFEGEAMRVTDGPTLEEAAHLYREAGWPAEVEGDAFTAPFSAPSEPPPPYALYRFTFDTAFGLATAEPHGATRWRFRRREEAEAEAG